MDYNSFIYIWRNKETAMLYIGKHFGHVNDGYVCSSKRMRIEYRRNPHYFRRRILAYVTDTTGSELLAAETFWLSKIKDSELGTKYYNLKNKNFGNTRGVPKSYTWNKGLSKDALQEYQRIRKQKLFCLLSEKPTRGVIYKITAKITCPTCDGEFETKVDSRIYCSKSCAAKSPAGTNASRNNGYKRGLVPYNKGTPHPASAENGKKSAAKLSAKCKGRKRHYKEDGTWTWVYPDQFVELCSIAVIR